MDERDWQIIKTLYEQKNITKTAKLLYITQPALSSRIKQIEEDLGVTLLHRSNKGITFTAKGKYAVTVAERVLKNMSHFREKIANIEDEELKEVEGAKCE